ncbi:MAG TPA: PQQ-binding-like beta-propeller repeat protein [Pyrinomonadaceae bacterium]|nr:PQQ-binding-like beta-propeller repeat protein [Pyrinomonadaceae bacterium]
MACSRYVRFLPVLLTLFSVAAASGNPLPAQRLSAGQTTQNPTTVTVRWGARPGVTRYRLQLASDSAFADIVFDRVVSGHEYRISDLTPGKYFWRVAALGSRRGDFSSAGVIEVRNGSANDALPTAPPKNPTTNAIVAGAGWYAAIGNVSDPILVSLRSPNMIDVIAVTAEGRVFALDGLNGVALWSTRKPNGSGTPTAAVAVRNRSGLDDVLVLSANMAMMLSGKTGREIWRSTLPGPAGSAVAVNSKIYVLDNSLQKLFVLDGSDGRLIARLQLPRRAAGPPAVLDTEVMIALDDGRLQVVDQAGKVTRSADAGSPATTAPVFVRTARGGLILIGTKSGLTALNAADLRPLGRIALKDETPRAGLTVRDLDADGIAEVIMFTDRGRVVVIKSDDGKVVWEADARQAASVAFADLNNDRVLDLLMAGREGFAFALSGRDGAFLWEESLGSVIAANHAPAAGQRSAQVAPSRSGVLLIAGDPVRGGLRAIEFNKGTTPPR